MSFYLFKLRFTAAVHFGSGDGALNLYSSEETFRADTLFSALCHTALSLGGESELNRLVQLARDGVIRFSDSMPFCGDTLYLPKPCALGENSTELPADERKAVKKLRWLPVEDIPAFSESIRGGKPFVPREEPRFGVHQERTGARIAPGEDTLPYQIGCYRFMPDCGLWFLCSCAEEQFPRLEKLVTALGLGGIGGKIGAGFGSFELYEDPIDLDAPFDPQTDWLSQALHAEASKYLLLSSALPREEELASVLDDAAYQLIRRGGYVRSEMYNERPLKKATQYFIASGAVLSHPFEGDIYDVGNQGSHPVYRYGKPIFLGVAL